jgi:ATP/maltotriose-dependent transcriptional regulator MalT
MAIRTLSPKQIQERARLHRQAVALLARLAAKRAVQENLRAQGVRVHAELMRQAGEYLANHPELYQLALERAHKLGYVGADVMLAFQQTGRHSLPNRRA